MAKKIKLKSYKISYDMKAAEKNVNEVLKRIDERVYGRLEALYQRVFGSQTTLEDWGVGARVNIPRSTLRDRLKKEPFTKFGDGLSSDKKLLEAYSVAWKNKYAQIIKDYQSADPEYPEKRWAKWKKNGLRKRYPSHKPDSKVRYVGWGLTTGYLRDSILRGFKSGGNRILQVPNILLQGGYSINFSEFEQSGNGRSHYEEFIELMVKRGVLNSEDDFLEFADNDWRRIASVTFALVKNNFVDEIAGLFD